VVDGEAQNPQRVAKSGRETLATEYAVPRNGIKNAELRRAAQNPRLKHKAPARVLGVVVSAYAANTKVAPLGRTIVWHCSKLAAFAAVT
jgi:hypothetical protein